jgi:hypothetical protein
MFRQAILTVGVCFGIGLSLAPLISMAHAYKCDGSQLTLELDSIEGDADSTIEDEFWANTGWLTGFDAPSLRLTLDGPEPVPQSIELEPR